MDKHLQWSKHLQKQHRKRLLKKKIGNETRKKQRRNK